MKRATTVVCRSFALALLSACTNESSHVVDGGSALDAGRASVDAGKADAGEDCTPPPKGLPSDVFCTGLYVGHDPTKVASDVRPYKPGVVLWSDGAEKQRWLYLPPNARIDTSNLDSWKFPVGTKAWKQFKVDGKLVETRLFWKRDETTWESGTYIWTADGLTATLNTSRKPTLLKSGYEIPTARDCGKCHQGGADQLLGVEAIALALPTAEGLTLAELATLGALTNPPDETSITIPEDDTGKAAQALGYLHANCGMPCHSTRGLGDETMLVLRLRADELWPSGTGTSSDAGSPSTSDAGSSADGGASADAGSPPAPGTVQALDAYRATVNQPPTTASVAQKFPGARRITPGAHDKSLVWLLAHIRGKYQMPPLVSHEVDDVGMAALAAWIDALPHP